MGKESVEVTMSFRTSGAVLLLLTLVLASLGQGLLRTDASAEETILVDAASDTKALTSVVDLGLGNGSLAVTWQYKDENARSNIAIAGAMIDLVSSGNVMARAITDANGSVLITGLAIGSYEIVIYAEDQYLVAVTNGSDTSSSVYHWTTGIINVTGNAVITRTIIGTEREAWNAYDIVRNAADWLHRQVNWTRDKVTVCWPYEDWPHSHGDEIHISASTVDYEFIWDDYILSHEYGHCVMYAARNDSFPDITGPDPHYLDSESNGAFAFVEGWAEFFGCAVLNDPNISGTLSLESTVFADGPLHNSDYGDWDGLIVEGAVANVLWDLYDGVSSTDHPSWDRSGYGDNIDNELATFWQIFLNDGPETMDEVWSLWQEKNDSLTYVFRHARFNYEVSLPTNPTDFTSSVEVDQVVNDSVIVIQLIGATDTGSGIAGYSILWDQSPEGEPDQYIDVYGSVIQISDMSAGTWYLHVRAIDGSGNAANGSFDIGPFIVGSASDSTSLISLSSNDILLIAGLAVGLIILIYIVSRVVRKPTAEDVKPYVPPYRPYNPYFNPYYNAPYYGGMAPATPAPSYYQPAPPSQPSTPDQAPSPASPSPDQGQIRYCMGCGRPDAGGAFCPYCGTKVR